MKYYQGDQMKDKMSGACGTYGGEYVQDFGGEKLKE
jgi:hypothetical protein